jgi:NAD(P)-dependent dehydrogenase (short-subunit alcohol dehydrogenase family)
MQSMTPPSLGLSGKTALVTGGNRGIGLGIASALAGAGAAVCIWGRDAQRSAEAVATLSEGSFAIQCDISDEGQVDRAFSEAVERLGHVDACFINAGFLPEPQRLADTSAAEWRRVLATNLDGSFYTLRAAARHMVERNSGSICLISSVSAIDGTPRQYAYAASKSAMVALAKSAAAELGKNRIRVNALLPGWTDTEALAPLLRSEDGFAQRWRETLLGRIPLRRWGRPDDLGGIAVYLASDASSYHTGDAIVLDGGYTVF